MPGDEQIGQDEIEQLLRQAQQASGAPAPGPAAAESAGSVDQGEIERLMAGGKAAPTKAPPRPAAPQRAADGGVAQDDIELLLRKAEQALASIDEPGNQLPPGVQTFRFADFTGSTPNTESATL